jgi:hypothetical protein
MKIAHFEKICSFSDNCPVDIVDFKKSSIFSKWAIAYL